MHLFMSPARGGRGFPQRRREDPAEPLPPLIPAEPLPPLIAPLQRPEELEPAPNPLFRSPFLLGSTSPLGLVVQRSWSEEGGA